jgi:hypothetical protein
MEGGGSEEESGGGQDGSFHGASNTSTFCCYQMDAPGRVLPGCSARIDPPGVDERSIVNPLIENQFSSVMSADRQSTVPRESPPMRQLLVDEHLKQPAASASEER